MKDQGILTKFVPIFTACDFMLELLKKNCISNERLICSCAEVSYDSSDDSCDEVHFGSLDSEEEVISTCAPSQCLFCDSFNQTGEQVSFF